jgi:hypothetical protein
MLKELLRESQYGAAGSFRFHPDIFGWIGQ